MRTVEKSEFDQYIIDFSDGGYHAVEQSFPVTSLDGGTSLVQYSNPDVGLIGEVYTEGAKVTYQLSI